MTIAIFAKNFIVCLLIALLRRHFILVGDLRDDWFARMLSRAQMHSRKKIELCCQRHVFVAAAVALFWFAWARTELTQLQANCRHLIGVSRAHTINHNAQVQYESAAVNLKRRQQSRCWHFVSFHNVQKIAISLRQGTRNLRPRCMSDGVFFSFTLLLSVAFESISDFNLWAFFYFAASKNWLAKNAIRLRLRNCLNRIATFFSDLSLLALLLLSVEETKKVKIDKCRLSVVWHISRLLFRFRFHFMFISRLLFLLIRDRCVCARW